MSRTFKIAGLALLVGSTMALTDGLALWAGIADWTPKEIAYAFVNGTFGAFLAMVLWK